jgi:ABC-type sugar transport system substrate-binding protein
MKKRGLFLLLLLAALLSSLLVSQTALAAERIVELRTPGCV